MNATTILAVLLVVIITTEAVMGFCALLAIHRDQTGSRKRDL
jgi:hypothetical protein